MIFGETGNQFLGTERMGRLMRQYAIPCIISLLVGALYNIVDQIFIANADYVIDMGPVGGDAGGQIVCAGTPGDIVACSASITGRYL